MNRLTTVITKVRPIKKLFIIEQSDFRTLASFIKIVSKEIEGFRNLILVNDDNLSSCNTIAFVKAHDPDIVVNCSFRSNVELDGLFKTRIVTFDEAKYYSTSLFTFRNMPLWSRAYSNVLDELRDDVYTLKLDEGEFFTEDQLLFALHCGCVKLDFSKTLKGTIFQAIKVKALRRVADFWRVACGKKNNLYYLSTNFSQVSYSSSIWAIDNNREDKWSKVPTIIVGDFSDLSSIAYFWNCRATFPSTTFIWIPRQRLAASLRRLEEFKVYCAAINLSEEEKLEMKQHNKKAIDGSRYYFSEMDEWDGFKHVQSVAVIDNKLKVSHPPDRMFAPDLIHCTFEIRGKEEAILPKSSSLGELFIELPDEKIFREHFARISNKGISIYVRKFDFLSSQDFLKSVSLPDQKKTITALFAERELRLSETSGSRIIERILRLVGGPEGLLPFQDRRLFEMIVGLAPKRIDRVVTKLSGFLIGKNESELHSAVEEIIRDMKFISPQAIVNGEQLLSSIRKEDRQSSSFQSSVETLVKNKILLRGKHFVCPHCDSSLWFQFDTIKEDLKCYCCNQVLHVPVFQNGQLSGDAFRLNELLCTAVDQGVLPVLLTILLMDKQRFYAKRYMFDCNVYDKNEKFLGEIDIISTLGNRIGLGEIKADRGFAIKQVERLLRLAERMEAGFVYFSSLKSVNSPEIEELMQCLASKNLSIPAFVIGQESLFNDKPINLSRYFRVKDNKFPTGPILCNP